MSQLEKFITDNKLEFTVGRRNSDAVVLCGFALYNNQSVENCKNAIPENVRTVELFQEVERVYDYAKRNNYGSYWSTADAQKRYIF